MKGLVRTLNGLSAVLRRCSLDREYGHKVVIGFHVGIDLEVFWKLDATAFSPTGLLNLSANVVRDSFMALEASWGACAPVTVSYHEHDDDGGVVALSVPLNSVTIRSAPFIVFLLLPTIIFTADIAETITTMEN